MAPVEITGRVTNADMPDATRVVSDALEAAVQEAVALLERESKRRMPIGATEVGRGSIAGEVQRGSQAYRGYAVRGLVQSPQAHVSVIDRGRRAGERPPPADALELWVRRKLGVRNVKEARAIAFVIARSIGRRGVKGLRFYDAAVNANAAALDRIFRRAGVEISVRVTK